ALFNQKALDFNQLAWPGDAIRGMPGQWRHDMQRIGTSLRLSLAAAAALLLIGTGAGPVRAQMSAMDHDAAVPCSAFQRMGGAWTAVAPVTLNIDNGMSLSFAAGDTMAAGSTV